MPSLLFFFFLFFSYTARIALPRTLSFFPFFGRRNAFPPSPFFDWGSGSLTFFLFFFGWEISPPIYPPSPPPPEMSEGFSSSRTARSSLFGASGCSPFLSPPEKLGRFFVLNELPSSSTVGYLPKSSFFFFPSPVGFPSPLKSVSQKELGPSLPGSHFLPSKRSLVCLLFYMVRVYFINKSPGPPPPPLFLFPLFFYR